MHPSQKKTLRIALESIRNAVDSLRERLEQHTRSENGGHKSQHEGQEAIVSAIVSLRVTDEQRDRDEGTQERRHAENLEQQRENLTQQKWLTRWTALAFLAAAIYAGIAGYQLSEMRKATDAAARSADAATSAATTTAKQLDLSERPWVKIAYTLHTPKELIGHIAKPGITFNSDGSLSLNGVVKATNVGNSVATRLYIQAKLTVLPTESNPMYRLVRDQAKWCEEATKENQSPVFLDSVLPRDSLNTAYTVGMNAEEVKRGIIVLPNGSKLIEPVVYVCAVYASSFNSKHDSTGVIYLLSPVPIPSRLPETVDGTRLSVSNFLIGGPYYR